MALVEWIYRGSDRRVALGYLLVITALLSLFACLAYVPVGPVDLDKRNSVLPLVTAHALTALPSSFLPFKLGEVLRLTAFFCVFDARQKPLLSGWLKDLATYLSFPLSFWVFTCSKSTYRQACALSLLFLYWPADRLVGMFAVAKVFVYLNRHLVTTSLSPRGLLLLRTSHVLRSLR